MGLLINSLLDGTEEDTLGQIMDNIMAGKKGMRGSGGARKGAGRKPKEPTKTLSFRVPAKHSEGLKTACEKTIAAYLKKHATPS